MMDQAELENTKFQLQQVEEALADDPNNEELQQLKQDLLQLMDLMTEVSHEPVISHASSSHSAPVVTSLFKIGDMVEAKYSGNWKWYEARIEALNQKGAYNCLFTHTGNAEFVEPQNVRAVSAGKVFTVKKPLTNAASIKPLLNADGTNKKKKKQTYQEFLDKKDVVHKDRQSAWLNFTKKTASSSAGKRSSSVPVKPAINKKSIFATQDTGKVGVVGSGLPMTQFPQREKHRYDGVEMPKRK